MSHVQSIKCTNCAAPLKLLGGGRVESITCSYCKSVLDLNNDYKVLSNFKNIKEQYKLPFDIGMKGKLKGIEYIIIGRVTYKETLSVEHGWSDFLLFSPLYGYAWLTYEEGHLIYSKRNRTFPSLSWDEISHQHSVTVERKNYQPYDNYTAKITYVEGELTWIAKYGDKIEYIDLISPPFGMTVENSGTEIEFYDDEYMNANEVYEAFLVPKERREKNDGFHPLKPFEQPLLKVLSKVSLWFMVIIGLLMIAFIFDGHGKNLTHFNVDNRSSVTEPFTLSTTKYLTSIDIKADSAKALNNFNLKLFKDGKLLFSLTQKSTYIFDTKTNKVSKRLETWEKRAKEVVVYLNLEKLGVYQLSVLPIDSAISSSLTITVKEKSSRLNYLLLFMFLLLFLFLLYYFFLWRYNHKLSSEKEINKGDGIFENINNWGQVILWIVVAFSIIFFGKD